MFDDHSGDRVGCEHAGIAGIFVHLRTTCEIGDACDGVGAKQIECGEVRQALFFAGVGNRTALTDDVQRTLGDGERTRIHGEVVVLHMEVGSTHRVNTVGDRAVVGD